MHVLVTGATGFLGNRLVDELLAADHQVRALVRATSDTQALQRRDVPCVVGSLLRGDSLAQAVSDVDAVIHCAGGGLSPYRQTLYADNVTTTQVLVSAIRQHRPQLKRLIVVSSVSAHGPSPNGLARPDEAPRSPTSEYGRCKAKAEAVVLDAAEEWPVTIVRPPAIYGPGDRRMLPLFRAAQRGWVPLPSSCKTLSLIHVDDCARALCQVLDNDTQSGRCFSVEDGTPRAMDELVQMIGGALGRSPSIVRIPRWVVRIVGALSGFIARFRKGAIMLTSDKVHDLLQPHWVCDAKGLRDEMHWMPQVVLRDGLLDTAQWYKEQRWIR